MSNKRTKFMDEYVWDRHANPKSGWSRLLAWPVMIVAVYVRKWWLLGLTALFMLVNPVLFGAPMEELDDWMYKVVRAEQRWMNDGNRSLRLGYPQILNTLSIPAMLYAVYAAYKQKPLQTMVFTITPLGLNQWCMKEIIDHYESIDSE